VFVLFLPAILATAPTCRPASGDGPALVRQAIDAIGASALGSHVRTSSVKHVFHMKFQSDRMYPPYLWLGYDGKVTADWKSGVIRIDRSVGPQTSSFIADSARRAAVSPRGAMIMPAMLSSSIDERAMDAWMVLADWRSATDVRVVGECEYRDYWRTVLERRGAMGLERLFLNSTTGVPIKLERREPHMLWGDVLVEYLWQIWTPVKGTRALSPQFAFRMVDGEIDDERTYDAMVAVPRDSAGALAIPATAMTPPPSAAAMPDTVRVSANTFLLVTRAYTNVVTLQKDTVFVLDAQTDQQRAAADSAWIGKLFPGRHPIVLVVTDLAWPHIAGVRYWIGLGAPVVSYRASGSFLNAVASRRWTLAPDLLERRRATAKLRFRPVTSSLSLAGGAVQVRPIDGAGSEGGLMVFLPGERFLYAGDYIQPGGPDSFSATYAREVAAAVRRNGFTPERFAAMHVGLTDWNLLAKFTGTP
jgi:hypothetical protein